MPRNQAWNTMQAIRATGAQGHDGKPTHERGLARFNPTVAADFRRGHHPECNAGAGRGVVSSRPGWRGLEVNCNPWRIAIAGLPSPDRPSTLPSAWLHRPDGVQCDRTQRPEQAAHEKRHGSRVPMVWGHVAELQRCRRASLRRVGCCGGIQYRSSRDGRAARPFQHRRHHGDRP
jgi:hypothetical protein